MTATAAPDNVAVWFEIPAANFDRAVGFYERVFGTALRREKFGPADMAVFPAERQAAVSGCIVMREAIVGQRRLSFQYKDAGDKPSERKVRPLGLYFWGQRWTLAAWCEMRQDFRDFRLDRTTRAAIGDKFPHEPGKRLDDFLRAMQA